MGYLDTALTKIMNEYDHDRTVARLEREKRVEEVHEKFPEILEIEKEINRLINEGIQAELFEAIKKSEYADAIKRFDSNESIVMGMVDCAINGSDLFEGVKVLKEITQNDVIDRLKTLNKESSVLSVILPQKES